MINPLVTSILLMTMGLGTIITFASSHWLLAWMGIELNTLAILPILAGRHHSRATEASVKYFLIQVTAAAMLLFATCSNAWFTGEWNIQEMTHPLSVTMAIVALALKLGLVPLHTWMPEVLQGLDLIVGLIVATWQKLGPLVLLFQITPRDSQLLLILGAISVLVAGWAGLNQVQVRKVLAYSSIAHMGWMVVALHFSTALAILTLLIYLVMTAAAYFIFNVNKTYTLYSLHRTPSNPATITVAILVLLSLGGLPPLTGFMTKWLIIQELTIQSHGALVTLLVFSALLSLYYYLRLSHALTLTMPPRHVMVTALWRLNPPNPTPLMPALIAMAIALLPIMPIIASLTL
uniref:NADH-ubiquinone oxidoreductase chain 2 n=1 Tax=Upeneus japonicus TaxID=435235 RepID=A0A060NTG8_9TELE|nr:NADH dehydrogenase subunit 2 [Upeneus japonicus]UPV69471.1 NADH dehydrogenase subunit 2 [Upeneus japonicus]BAO84655.1 NADH dehydrogenase subunit 2 [Upeneus japonicus]